MADPGRILLQVDGVAPQSLHSQTLFNLWVPEKDPPEHRLAHIAFATDDLRDDLLERLTWNLLAAPHATQLHLIDSVSRQKVAVVVPAGGSKSDGRQEVRQWHDRWLKRPAAGSGLHGDAAKAPSASPRDQDGSRTPGGTFTGLDELALARRERLKYRLQRVLGRRGTAVLQRTWGTLRPVLHARRDSRCLIDANAVKALAEVHSTLVGDGREALGVLMLLPRLSPGGAEKNALDLATALIRRGTPVHMVTTFGSANTWSDRARTAGAQVWHLPDFLPRGCWLGFLDSYIARHAIGVVHINNSHWMYDNLPRLKARHPHLRVISQIHAEGDWGDLDYPTQAARKDRYIDCHTVISEHLATRLAGRHGVDPDKIRVVRTGIDIEHEFAYPVDARGRWRQGKGIDAQTPLVAFVGRFSDLKRPLVFLEMAQRVLEQRPDTRFVMKGGGPLLNQIERYLAGKPELAGAVLIEDARAAVMPLMVDADLLVLTSAMEGVAYVSYEAMALGLVQISADVGAQSELVTPDSGVLVTVGQGEVERFADAVCSLLADEDRRTRLSGGARERIRQWPGVQDMALQYLSVYGFPGHQQESA